MQKKTRSLLEELDAMYIQRDQRHVIETRASNVIASAIRLLEQIDETYNPNRQKISGVNCSMPSTSAILTNLPAA
jgi:hypothetical protein